jgi:hypothetical protein
MGTSRKVTSRSVFGVGRKRLQDVPVSEVADPAALMAVDDGRSPRGLVCGP